LFRGMNNDSRDARFVLAGITRSSLYSFGRGLSPIFRIFHVILDDLQLGHVVPCVVLRLD